ncbi:MAG: dockerin type I domain-containing protein [Planctomycetota bacterium]
MKHLIPAIAIMVSAAVLGAFWPSTASADSNGEEFTYLLSDDSPELGASLAPPADPDPPFLNWIFTTDASSTPIPRFDDLAVLLRRPGEDPRVISLSFGMDQVERLRPHGDVHYSVAASSQPTSTSGGASGAVLLERFNDVLADLFRTDNTIDLAHRRGPSEKSMEENSSVLPGRTFRNFPVDASAGLKGGWTGVPFPLPGEQPSNIVGFDYHDPLEAWGYQDTVFFTVDRSFQLTGNWYYPFQVLAFNRVTSTLSIHKDLRAEGFLGQTDVIDALSMDLVHSAAINQDESILFSITRQSGSVSSVPGISQADIFQFPKPNGTTSTFGDLRDLLYRTAFASGVHPIDGDIDSIVSIDPLGERRYAWVTPPGLPATGFELEPIYAPLDELYLYPLNSSNNDPDDPIHSGRGGPIAISLSQGQDRSYRVLGTVGGEPVDAGTLTVGVIPEMVPNPCGAFSVTPGAPGQTTFSWVVEPGASFNAATQDWEVSFNGTVRQTGDNQSLDVNNTELVPGSHALGVRLIDTTGNNSHSGYEYLAHWVDPAPGFDAPIVRSITVQPNHLTGSHQTTLVVEHVRLFTQLRVSVNGNVASSHPCGGTSTVVLIPTDQYGPQDIQVWGEDSASNRSISTRAFTFMPRAQPGEVTANTLSLGTPFVTGMTVYEESTLTWIVVIDDAGSVWRYDEDLQSGEQIYPTYQGNPSPLTFENQGSPHGVTQVGSGLYWLVETSSGYELQSTMSLFSAASTVDTVNEGYANGGIVAFVPGDIAARDNNRLVLADRSVENLAGVQYRMTDLSGDLVDEGLTTINPWFQQGAGAVAWMDVNASGLSDAMIVPFHDGVMTTAFVALGDDSTVEHLASTSLPGWTLALAYQEEPFQASFGSASLYAAVLNYNGQLGFHTTIYRVAAPRGTTPEYDIHHAAHRAVSATTGPTVLTDATPDAPASLMVSISDAFTIGDVDLIVDVAPEESSQFGITLVSPQGTRVQLEGRVRLDETNRLHYDDLGSGSRDDLAGNRRSSEALALFDGEPSDGEWKVELHSSSSNFTAEMIELRIAPLIEPYDVPRGDLDFDGDVDGLDWLFMEYYLTQHLPMLVSPEAYDLDGNGVIDDTDMNLLNDMIAASALPVCSPDNPNDLGSVYPGYCP